MFTKDDRGELGTLYLVSLDPKWTEEGLEVIENTVELFPFPERRGAPKATSVLLPLKEDSNKPFLSLLKDNVLGELLHILPAGEEADLISQHHGNVIQVLPVNLVGSPEEAEQDIADLNTAYKSYEKKTQPRSQEEIKGNIPRD